MDELIELVKQEKNFVLKDYFEFDTIETVDGDLLIDVIIKDKGQQLLTKKKTADANFDEQVYFEKLIRTALSQYIASQKEDEEEEQTT